ncbi:unnamed protein product [Ceratitis capitata]|uniref:(Mediterranean fruit fly) hypothetical protein n=1 Tax=Ceratitis capitata TaxID=7213 RepID=A0A811UL20_CERCA|nr:unnamed protein product [Ceratitis capitata]
MIALTINYWSLLPVEKSEEKLQQLQNTAKKVCWLEALPDISLSRPQTDPLLLSILVTELRRLTTSCLATTAQKHYSNLDKHVRKVKVNNKYLSVTGDAVGESQYGRLSVAAVHFPLITATKCCPLLDDTTTTVIPAGYYMRDVCNTTCAL